MVRVRVRVRGRGRVRVRVRVRVRGRGRGRVTCCVPFHDSPEPLWKRGLCTGTPLCILLVLRHVMCTCAAGGLLSTRVGVQLVRLEKVRAWERAWRT